jgi:hypothetical protein
MKMTSRVQFRSGPVAVLGLGLLFVTSCSSSNKENWQITSPAAGDVFDWHGYPPGILINVAGKADKPGIWTNCIVLDPTDGDAQLSAPIKVTTDATKTFSGQLHAVSAPKKLLQPTGSKASAKIATGTPVAPQPPSQTQHFKSSTSVLIKFRRPDPTKMK